MSFGISLFDGRDMLSEYANSAGTGGLAQAFSGSFQASPSFEVTQADNPFQGAAFAGTGLSRARNLDVGGMTYSQALNVAPPGGAMITKEQALAGLDLTPVNLLLLAAAGYFGRQKFGNVGLALGPLAALGILKLLDK